MYKDNVYIMKILQEMLKIKEIGQKTRTSNKLYAHEQEESVCTNIILWETVKLGIYKLGSLLVSFRMWCLIALA